MVKNILPYQNMKILYNNLIQLYLEYGIINWGGTYENHLNKQKKNIRMITLSKYNEHTKPIFQLYPHKRLNLCVK